jgi:hypothetical protein
MVCELTISLQAGKEGAMRRAVGETLISALGLLVLISVLVAFDPRVRDRVSTIAGRGGAETTLASVSATASDVGSALLSSARAQSLEHAPLLVFGVAAVVLVTFMLRT